MDFKITAADRQLGDVTIVHSIADGMEQLAHTEFDWGVLDLRLRDGVAFELADVLKSQGARICFLTGQDVDAEQLAKYDAKMYMKPVWMPDVCDFILENS